MPIQTRAQIQMLIFFSALTLKLKAQYLNISLVFNGKFIVILIALHHGYFYLFTVLTDTLNL